MHSMKTAALAALALMMVFGSVQVTSAGVEPSPFKPEINQLGAVVNSLNSIHERINRVLAMPPDDQSPSPNIKGAVNRLGAMENKLFLLDDMVGTIAEEVMGIPPNDQHDPTDVVTALDEVANSADGIADRINQFLGLPPDDIMPEFLGALGLVRDAAMDVNATATFWSGEIGGGEPPVEDCSLFSNFDDCDSNGCSWVYNQDTGLGECVETIN